MKSKFHILFIICIASIKAMYIGMELLREEPCMVVLVWVQGKRDLWSEQSPVSTTTEEAAAEALHLELVAVPEDY